MLLRSCHFRPLNKILTFTPAAFVQSFKVSSDSLYAIFGVSEDCTHQDIKDAFYRLSKLYHPDVTNDPDARAKFQEIARAYEILGNPSKRQNYDRGLVKTVTSDLRSSRSYDTISKDSLRDFSADSFDAFYVKHYNRALNDTWLRRSDPAIRKTAMEYHRDKRFTAVSLLLIIAFFYCVGFVYYKLTEQPIEFVSSPIRVSNSK